MPKAKKEENSEKGAEWVKMKPEEVEKIVVDLAKKGTSPEKIGLVLRDEYGIPKVKIFGKKISKILKEKELYTNSEIANTERKLEKAKKHFEKHKHDYSAQRAIMKRTGRINKLNKVYS